MSDSAYRVETTSRLAQWRIENLASFTYRKSDPFKIGKWNWHLSVEKNRTLIIKLYPEISTITRQHPPIASFVIKVVSSVGDRKCLVHPEITDKLLKCNEDFVWAIEAPLTSYDEFQSLTTYFFQSSILLDLRRRVYSETIT